MTQNFAIDLSGANFEFISMNRVKLQLFQVRVQNDGKNHRFHMQLNDTGTFYITDKQTCPEIFHDLESAFSDAVIKLGEVSVINEY